jgi:hypothetical protein
MGCPRFMAALCLSGALAVSPVPAPAQSGATVTAVWRKQHLQFAYLGFTMRYTCDGLRDKVRAMLIELGARRDLHLLAQGCADSGAELRRGGPIPRLVVDFYSPAPASPDKPKPAQPGDPEPFEARYEPFRISTDVFRNMGAGECELVEEFARQILPKLATRAVTQKITCVPYQESGSSYRVIGEVLRAVPKP